MFPPWPGGCEGETIPVKGLVFKTLYLLCNSGNFGFNASRLIFMVGLIFLLPLVCLGIIVFNFYWL